MNTYSKIAMTNHEHLAQWESRGLVISNKERALRYLSHISYYRLSAYTIPFYAPDEGHHTFKTSTSFDDVLSLYVFDRELRLLIMDAIERIEVSVRAHLCNHMSVTYGNDAFWYLNEKHFAKKYGHKRLLADLERQIDEERRRYESDLKQLEKRTNISPAQKKQLLENIQKETFLRHYLCKYDEPRLPPCWMMVELLTWGSLSHLYNGLGKASDQKAIASGLGCNAELLQSWLKSFNIVRNHCAHHNRLWNREFGLSIKIPKSSGVKWLETSPVINGHIRYEKRLYPVLAAIQSLLYTISPSSTWALKLSKLLSHYPQVSLSNMGVPDDWEQDPFWNKALNK